MLPALARTAAALVLAAIPWAPAASAPEVVV
jgi:hypothetical protein